MSGNLKKLVKWFNELTDKQREDIYKHFEFIAFYPEEQNFNKFKELRNEITNLISTGTEREKVIEKLTLAGLEEDACKNIYNYCEQIVKPLQDLQIVKSLDTKSVSNIMNFIIYKMYIYREFKHYPFQSLVELGNFNNRIEAGKALRFLHKIVFQVADREISPDTTELILLNDYDLSQDLIEVIINLLTTNASELHQARLTSAIDEILTKIEELYEDEDDTETEEESAYGEAL